MQQIRFGWANKKKLNELFSRIVFLNVNTNSRIKPNKETSSVGNQKQREIYLEGNMKRIKRDPPGLGRYSSQRSRPKLQSNCKEKVIKANQFNVYNYTRK